ncbi:MAG: AMP-binding protein, partial [Thermoleophilia bacterium]|nr:AMP-binding protein [Thermoleophilia bacterium]
SGSTGQPKAIVRDHDAWLKSFVAMTAEFGVGPGTPVAVPGSLFFSFSLIAALHALTVGATMHVPARAGVAGIFPTFVDGAVAYLLPSVLDEVARSAWREQRAYPGVRTVICAGERLRPETREAAATVFPDAVVVEYYGASELGFVTVMPPGEAATRPGSVGRAFAGSAVVVLGDDGRELPPGEVGLLCVRNEYGGQYPAGQEGAEALEHHGWRTVGDLAWRDADGFVFLAGRRDSMVVVRGENVYPEQVEAVIAGKAGVRAVGVTAAPADRPAHLVAVVAADEGVTGAAILGRCRGALSGRRVPRRVVFVADLPRTEAGKLDRRALAALVADPTSGQGEEADAG